MTAATNKHTAEMAKMTTVKSIVDSAVTLRTEPVK